MLETAMKKFLSASCSYLLKNLPMEVPVIRDSGYLHPSKHAGSKAIDTVSQLAVEVHTSLGSELFRKVFGKAMPKLDFCDVIRKEMKEFQLEKILDSFFAEDEEWIKSWDSKAPYWATCYEEFDVVPDYNPSTIDVEAYWNKVSSIINENGNPRYCHLLKVALMILWNADPERGFSVSEKILEKHGNNIDEDTLESVGTVKDFLIWSGGQSVIEVQKETIQQCKSSWSKYQKYLEEKRAQKKEEEKQKQNEV